MPVSYAEEQQAIATVQLVRPRPGVFAEAINHLLVICTTTEASGQSPLVLGFFSVSSAGQGATTLRSFQQRSTPAVPDAGELPTLTLDLPTLPSLDVPSPSLPTVAVHMHCSHVSDSTPADCPAGGGLRARTERAGRPVCGSGAAAAAGFCRAI